MLKMRFGKHKGKAQDKIPMAYLYWAFKTIKGFKVDPNLEKKLREYAETQDVKPIAVDGDSIVNSYYGFDKKEKE